MNRDILRQCRFGLRQLLFLLGFWVSVAADANEGAERCLYVASPGIHDYLEYGGHGILVFDIDKDHQFVRRIPLDGYGVDGQGKPINVKGVCASAATERIYVSTKRQLICLDLLTDQVLWQREYPLGCDRMSISPDGKTIYQPCFTVHSLAGNCRSNAWIARQKT